MSTSLHPQLAAAVVLARRPSNCDIVLARLVADASRAKRRRAAASRRLRIRLALG
jgi:hypothetical protein